MGVDILRSTQRTKPQPPYPAVTCHGLSGRANGWKPPFPVDRGQAISENPIILEEPRKPKGRRRTPKFRQHRSKRPNVGSL